MSGLPDNDGPIARQALLALWRAPGSSSSHLAARAAANLIELFGTTAGQTAGLAGLLSPEPDGPATFTVTIHGDPPTVRSEVDLATALTLARSAGAPFELVSMSPAGLRRTVLRGGPGVDLVFVYPAEGAFEGDEGQGGLAALRWEALLAGEREQVASKADLAQAERSLTKAIAAAHSESAQNTRTVDSSVKSAQAELTYKLRQLDESSREALATVARKDDIATVAAAIRQALSDIVVKVEETAQQAVKVAQADVVQKADVDALREALDTLSPLDEAAIAGAVRAVLAEAAAESGSVSPAAAHAAGVDADEIAHRVSEHLAARPHAAAGEVDAEAVAELVVGHLAGRVPGGWVAQATLLSASDQLQLQLEAFNDRIRSGARSLEALADELAAQERSATELTDQLARSIESSMAKLEKRLEKRLEELAAGESGERAT